jgi:hypothetical protein
LTADEVADVFGEAVSTARQEFDGCYRTVGDDKSLVVSLTPDDVFEQLRDLDPDTEELDVAGNPAYYAPFVHSLRVLTYAGTLGLEGRSFPSEESIRDQLVALAELALPRLPAIDAALEALFPTEIEGRAVAVQSMLGDTIATTMSPAMLEAFTGALATQGKTINDMSFASANTPAGSIYAIRVAGTDAAALAPAWIPVMMSMVSDPQQSPVTVAGKSVIRVTSGPPTDDPNQGSNYVYPKDDVVWFITSAGEPGLSEIIGKLP